MLQRIPPCRHVGALGFAGSAEEAISPRLLPPETLTLHFLLDTSIARLSLSLYQHHLLHCHSPWLPSRLVTRSPMASSHSWARTIRLSTSPCTSLSRGRRLCFLGFPEPLRPCAGVGEGFLNECLVWLSCVGTKLRCILCRIFAAKFFTVFGVIVSV